MGLTLWALLLSELQHRSKGDLDIKETFRSLGLVQVKQIQQ